jgi:hypothetical protein
MLMYVFVTVSAKALHRHTTARYRKKHQQIRTHAQRQYYTQLCMTSSSQRALLNPS